MTAQQARPLQYFPHALLPYENSVCRVIVEDRDYGARSHGSGVLLQSPASHTKYTFVLTAYHVVRERKSDTAIEVTWDGETKYPARVAACRPGCDGTLLFVENIPPEIPRVPIAPSDAKLGDKAYGFGFGSSKTNTLRCSGGTVYEYSMNQYNDNVWFSFAGRFRQGDSGGPVFILHDDKPYVVGCGWGSAYDADIGGWHVTGTRLTVLMRMLDKEEAPTNPHPGGRSARTITVGSPQLSSGGS